MVPSFFFLSLSLSRARAQLRKKDDQERKLLLTTHVRQLRERIPAIASSLFVFVPEANLGHEHRHLRNDLASFRNVKTAFCEKELPGIRTTEHTKGMYVDSSIEYLSTSAVVYHENAICVNPWSTKPDPAYKLSEAKKKLEFQLANFRKQYKIPPSGGAPKVQYSGKIDAEGRVSASLQDDLAMAFLINTYAEKAIRLGHLRDEFDNGF